MIPHYAYPSPWDRNYYFRPYNYFHVPQLQQTVAGWGQDPRNISDNRFFKAIYEKAEAEAAAPGVEKPQRLPPKNEPIPTPSPSASKPAGPWLPNPSPAEPSEKVAAGSAPVPPQSPGGAADSKVDYVRFVTP
jgi:hypothetical protein